MICGSDNTSFEPVIDSMRLRDSEKGFENILDEGVTNGWYDPGVLLQVLVCRWVFIPWLQAELDAYRQRINMTAKRRDRNKILPHGVPQHMLEFPDEYAILDFKIKVKQEHINTVRQQYADPSHDIFQLVPPDFAQLIQSFYVDLGEPSITRETCWEIYRQLLRCFEHLDKVHNIDSSVDDMWGFALTQAENEYRNKMQPLPNLRPLHGGEDIVGQDGGYYMGGVNGGNGLDDAQHAQLRRLIDEVEPNVAGETDFEGEDDICAWFSDEEGPDELAAADEW
ncbi:unnamed protein product [Mycena citricolor]|uniref:Uncharacterized protein n=1 Tax=Mycena citricolor TaxID=2018698 RepID=A0AAD2GUJ7_9AGAR|nr:unnamed protein product [Mycena citricolor]